MINASSNNRHVVRDYGCQRNDRKKHVNLAVSNLGDDEITSQNGKVKAITNNLDYARACRVRNSPKFHGDENGWHHSNGEYGQKSYLGLKMILSHAKHAEKGKSESNNKQNSDRAIDGIYCAQLNVLLNKRNEIVTVQKIQKKNVSGEVAAHMVLSFDT